MKKYPGMLVADDDENDLAMIARALPAHSASHPLCLVSDGGEALDYLHRQGKFAARPPGEPGCVLLDLHMPRVNGWEVLRQVKGDPGLRSIPIVIFSSSDRERDVEACYELGATAYVVKPIDAAAFRQTVTKIHAFWITCNHLARRPPAPSPPPSPGAARTRATPKYENA